MKNNIVLLCLALTLFSSCKDSNEKLIAKKWKTVSLEFPAMEEIHQQYREIMDTMTKNNPMVTQHLTLDSTKRYIKAQIAYELEIMQQNADNSFLELKSNHLAYFTSTEGTDSSAWRIEDQELILEDEKVTDIANTTRMHIDKLTDNELELRSIIGTDTSFIKMKPYTE